MGWGSGRTCGQGRKARADDPRPYGTFGFDSE